jgi:platelet-activating factor acetylhydrolase
LIKVFYAVADNESPPQNATSLKAEQIKFRQAEVEEVIKILVNITNGDGETVAKASSRGEGQTLSGWKDRIDLDHLLIGGHSFGGNNAVRSVGHLS